MRSMQILHFHYIIIATMCLRMFALVLPELILLDIMIVFVLVLYRILNRGECATQYIHMSQ